MATFFRNLKTQTLLVLCLLIPPFSTSISFTKSLFEPDATDILYQGDAVSSVGAIEFNKVNYINRVGWALYAESVHLWDSSTGMVSDFTSHFSFIIDVEGRSSYGHGLAFFLAPVGFQIPPNSGGGFLGLFNTSTTGSSRNQIVEVEFDSFPNEEWEPLVEHVGINMNSLTSAVYTPWNASFHSGDTGDAWITYNATTKNLSVSWSYAMTSNPRENSSLFYQIDLVKVLPEWVTVGFSAATGLNVERHILKSWEFSSSLETDTDGKKAKRNSIVIGVAVSFGVLIAFAASLAYVMLWKRKQAMKKTAENMHLTSMNDDLERGAGPRRFAYKDLAFATNNFFESRKLGEGGFGAVYRGYLIDLDMPIAVKRISRSSKQGKKEYITEVKIISRLRHRNLVQLLGWCHDRGEFLLVYEFMSNGSLDSHLFGKKNPLPWGIRYKISLGLASALLYLHEEWEQCVIHRDIKSSNVMLDAGHNAKLGDFGLARLMDHELGPQTTGLAGTYGYMAPEYIHTRRASKESDVYSFGIVALEIATGRHVVNPMEENSDMGLVEWIWNLYGNGKLHAGIDERLPIDYDEKQVECLMIIGLWCAHPDSNFRPTIRQVIQVLNFEAVLPNLPNKMPVPVYHAPTLSATMSSGEASITCTSLEFGR